MQIKGIDRKITTKYHRKGDNNIMKKTNKIISKRIQEIENYDYSLWNLVNPNTRNQLALNPIGAGVALTALQELRKELDGYDISLKEIDCNRVFGGNTELTETEVFIRSINSYLNYRNDYNKVIQTKELDRDFPRNQRQKIADELETEIRKEYKKIETIGKINKTLRRASEAKISELSSELRDILSTLEVPTEDYINNMLYLIAESKIKELKNRVDSKINYLNSIMGDIA